MSTKHHHKRWSISSITSFLAAGAVAAGMAVYAIVSYVADPSQSPLNLLLQHTWHVVALGVTIYVCVLVALRRLLVQPIHKIYVHLYGVGSGRLRPLHLDTSVRELAEIVAGVNLMIKRMDRGPEGAARGQVQEVVKDLRDAAHSRAAMDLELASQLTRAAKDLEHALAGLRPEV